MDSFDATSCSLINPDSIFTYNTAFHLEGIAVLSNNSQDATLAQLYVFPFPEIYIDWIPGSSVEDLSTDAMSAPEWVALNGTITEG